MRPILLIGFMGAGKSTVGALLAEELGVRFIDLDAEIERMCGASIVEIFASEGESAFRAAEYAALLDIRPETPAVIACGGGIVTTEAARVQLPLTGHVVFLDVTMDEAMARMGEDDGGRPLLSGSMEAVNALLESRQRLYSSLAEFRVETTGRSARDVADLIAAWARTTG